MSDRKLSCLIFGGIRESLFKCYSASMYVVGCALLATGVTVMLVLASRGVFRVNYSKKVVLMFRADL